MILSFSSSSLKDTLALGGALGAACKGGEAIELASDLGGGKTALTKGIAAGMGTGDTVQSPTFTVSRIYRCKNNLELHHFDFYRLSDPGIMAAELAESLSDKRAVVVVEWSDIVENILPANVIRIAITATGEEARELKISVPDSHQHIVEALQAFKGRLA